VLKLSGYSRTFWVANTLELFERFAYYGSKAILAVYLAEQVGLGSRTATFLAGSVFNTLLYLLPPLAGTIVDRYGFKRSLMGCFAIFSTGYFLIGFAGLPIGQSLVAAVGVKAWMSMALIVTAVGGSLIKPSIVGTVARTTNQETQALGYSIYYTLVNIGGAIGPVIADMTRVFGNLRFMLFLLIFSVPTLTGTIAAMMVFAVGESIQAPRYYEYVARLAPQDQVGTYMGFAFLPIAIGTFIAPGRGEPP